MIDFKFEITLGQVCEILVVLFAFVRWSNKMAKLEQKVNLMFHWWSKQLHINGAAADGD